MAELSFEGGLRIGGEAGERGSTFTSDMTSVSVRSDTFFSLLSSPFGTTLIISPSGEGFQASVLIWSEPFRI
jgi:hypothetical protein